MKYISIKSLVISFAVLQIYILLLTMLMSSVVSTLSTQGKSITEMKSMIGNAESILFGSIEFQLSVGVTVFVSSYLAGRFILKRVNIIPQYHLVILGAMSLIYHFTFAGIASISLLTGVLFIFATIGGLFIATRFSSKT